MSQLLFAGATLLWTGSWILIPLQLQWCPITTALGWRFMITALSLAIYCVWRGTSLNVRLSAEDWVRLVVQGLTNFGLNYWMVYLAASRMNFAFVGMMFMLLPLINAVGAKIFLNAPLPNHFLLRFGTVFLGLVLVFLPELREANSLGDYRSGVVCALAGLVCASIGNLLATRTQPKMGTLSNIAFALAIGGLGMLLIALLNGDGLVVPANPDFLLSLLYLGLLGGAVAFVAYFELIGRVGAANASSVMWVIPFLALILSALFNQIHWGLETLIGMLVVFIGNGLAKFVERRLPDPA
jgi:drug/metabolite transporter (DMT)-like permease